MIKSPIHVNICRGELNVFPYAFFRFGRNAAPLFRLPRLLCLLKRSSESGVYRFCGVRNNIFIFDLGVNSLSSSRNNEKGSDFFIRDDSHLSPVKS